MTHASSHRPRAAAWDAGQPWIADRSDTVRLPSLAVLGLWLLVLGSLFTGLPGPAALGELKGEGVLAGAAALMVFAAVSGTVFDARGARAAALLLPLALCILISYGVNAERIASAHFLGREGGEKFLSQLIVLGFYACVFYSLFVMMSVYGVKLVLANLRGVSVLAGVILTLVMGVEVISWFSPALRSIWNAARVTWTHGRPDPLYRIVGFATEPSFASMSALGILGLLGSQLAIGGSGGDGPRLRWRLLAALVVALFGVQLLANSRTFIAGAFGAAVAWVLLVPLGKALPASIKSAAIVLAPLPVQAGMIWVALQGSHGTHTVSNITRSIGILTGAELWRSNPLLGIGLGQYGFHFRAIIPSWGLQSYEISKYFRRDQYDLLGGLPPSFSLFTRLGAELGVLGLLTWILPQFYVIRRAIILCPGSMTTLMVCAFASNIWIGLSLDSFRNIYYWFWLAALLAWPQQCAYSNAPSQIPTAWSRQVRA